MTLLAAIAIAQCKRYQPNHRSCGSDSYVRVFGSADMLMVKLSFNHGSFTESLVHIHTDALTYLNAAITRSQYIANWVPPDHLELIGLASAHFSSDKDRGTSAALSHYPPTSSLSTFDSQFTSSSF